MSNNKPEIKLNIIRKRLEQLATGFFSRELINPSKIDELLIMVHPFAGDLYSSDNVNPDYKEKRDNLVATHEGPILFAFEGEEEEDEETIEDTLNWLDSLTKNKNRAIYWTPCANPHPIIPSQNEFVNAINSQFQPNKIRLCGAELFYQGNDIPKGCVGWTYHLLKNHFPTTIDEKVCWKPYS